MHIIVHHCNKTQYCICIWSTNTDGAITYLIRDCLNNLPFHIPYENPSSELHLQVVQVVCSSNDTGAVQTSTKSWTMNFSPFLLPLRKHHTGMLLGSLYSNTYIRTYIQLITLGARRKKIPSIKKNQAII